MNESKRTMPECRICLESNSEPMSSPCNCAGSAEYIHNECLREYLLYYPDGICRVCQTRMKLRDINDIWIACEIVFGLTMLIIFSEVPGLVKVVLTVATLACVYFYYKLHLLDTFIVKFLSVIPVFLLLGGLDPYNAFGVSVVLILALMTTYVVQTVPFIHIVIMLISALVASYIISVSYVLLYTVGIWANITMISLICLIGYGFVKAGR